MDYDMPRNTKTVESQSSYSQRLACHFSGASPDRVTASKAGLRRPRQPRSESKIVQTIVMIHSDFEYQQPNVPNSQCAKLGMIHVHISGGALCVGHVTCNGDCSPLTQGGGVADRNRIYLCPLLTRLGKLGWAMAIPCS